MDQLNARLQSALSLKEMAKEDKAPAVSVELKSAAWACRPLVRLGILSRKGGVTFADERVVIDSDTRWLPCETEDENQRLRHGKPALAVCKKSVVVASDKGAQSSLLNGRSTKRWVRAFKKKKC
jgi:hypothetical protein